MSMLLLLVRLQEADDSTAAQDNALKTGVVVRDIESSLTRLLLRHRKTPLATAPALFSSFNLSFGIGPQLELFIVSVDDHFSS